MERIYVRFPNWVGDVVMATSLLSELRRASAGAKMGVALRDYLSPLLWGICAEDEILPVSRPDEHSLLPLFQWQRRLRERAFDAAFIMPPSFSSALAPFMARIPIRAGWAENGRSALLTHAIKRIKPFHSQKMLEQYGLLLKAVFPRANQSLPAPKLRVTGRHERLAAEARKRCGLGELGRPLVVFAASGARGPAKRFIPSRFGAVADTLHRRLGGSFVLAGGGPGDAAELHAVRGFAGHSIQGVFVGDKANGLAELMGLLAQADLVIGNDTGTLHVAGALEKPVIAVFGSTSPVWTPPMGPATTILYKPAKCSPCYRQTCRYNRHWCMENVSVRDVLDAAEAALNEERRERKVQNEKRENAPKSP